MRVPSGDQSGAYPSLLASLVSSLVLRPAAFISLRLPSRT
jgi:hypothetical protein